MQSESREGSQASSQRSLPGRTVGTVLVLVLVLSIVLVQRFGGGASAPPATAVVVPPTPTVRPASLPSAAVYREGIVGLPTTLNPLLAQTEAERDATRLVFAGLTQLDSRGEVQPDLAERWVIGDDGKTYSFELRPDAKWHDGQPVTPQDVVYTVRLMQDSSFPGSRLLGAFWRTVQVAAVGSTGVRFTLVEPFAPFLSRTSFPVVPAHTLRMVYPADVPQHAFSQRPIGAGPFRLRDGLHEGDLLLERHVGYHGPRPQIEQVLLRFYPSLDEAILALRDGGIDALAGVPGARLAEVRGLPNVQVQTTVLNGYTALLFNLRRPALQQREVRQGLALAIDRHGLITEALDGLARPTSGPIVPSSWAFTEVATGGTIHEARALLERAGWVMRDGIDVRERDGRRLTLTLVTTDSPERLRLAAAISRQFEQAGVQVVVTALPLSELVARRLTPHDFDLALFGWSALGADPDPYSLWHSSQAERGFNFAGWNLPRADELLEGGRSTTNLTRRSTSYADFQRLFAQEVPSVILYCPYYHLVVTDRVHNVDPGALDHPADRYRTFTRWTVDPVAGVG